MLVDKLLASLKGRRKPRVLDLGCGAGMLGISAALANPDAVVVALDISAANIGSARQSADRAGVGLRVQTVCCDFLTWYDGHFDAIISDSVLYLIDGSDDVVANRLAMMLKPGGMLVATLPIESTINTVRLLARRFWRLLPESMDRVPLLLAKTLYPHFPREALADRIPYLRILPIRLYGASLERVFLRNSLEVVEETVLKSLSTVKLTHSLVVWRRR